MAASGSRRSRSRRVVYLLHFINPLTGETARYKHAGHYIGSTDDLDARLEKHHRGRGARLMTVIKEAGLDFTLARTWPGGRDRERQLKRRGGASRMCPKCGVKPQATQRPKSARLAVPAPVQAYQFEDWPVLSPGTRLEAAELADRLSRGAMAAYAAAAHAWGTAEYDSRFDMAAEVGLAASRVARETAELHGREPGEPVNEWITETRREARQKRQEEQVFGHRSRAEARQQAEADEQYREADRLADLLGESPDYQREITADRAARVMRILGDSQETPAPQPERAESEPVAPEPAGPELDAEIERLALAYPEPESAPAADAGAAHRSAGAQAAQAIVTAQAEAGLDPDRIAERHEDIAARLLSEAETGEARQFAAAYDDMAGSLVEELRRQARDRQAGAAWLQADGQPHSDPALADRGWHAQDGLWTRRTAARKTEREAG